MTALRALIEAATPGPWTAEALGSEGYGVLGYRDEGKRRHRIALVGHGAWEDDKTDARLIALAPQLADLLDRASSLIECPNELFDCLSTQRMRAAAKDHAQWAHELVVCPRCLWLAEFAVLFPAVSERQPSAEGETTRPVSA